MHSIKIVDDSTKMPSNTDLYQNTKLYQNTESYRDLQNIIKLVIDKNNGKIVPNTPYLINKQKKNITHKINDHKKTQTWMNQYVDLIVTQFIHYKIN